MTPPKYGDDTGDICPTCRQQVAGPGYLLVSEAELATALRTVRERHGANWSSYDLLVEPSNTERGTLTPAAAIFAALVAAQEKGT
jgi:hypothetical protein